MIATEGVFDWLTLRSWGYPAVALVGTHARPDIVDSLRTFQRVYLVLDQDDAASARDAVFSRWLTCSTCEPKFLSRI